jgi:hypothetical protein
MGKYSDGELDGAWEWWRQSGEPLQAGAFEGGKQVGLWKRFVSTSFPFLARCQRMM